MNSFSLPFLLSYVGRSAVLQLVSPDKTNKLSLNLVSALLEAAQQLRNEAEGGQLKSLVITGNDKFFSAGADLNEIAQLNAPEAFKFSRLGQRLTNAVD